MRRLPQLTPEEHAEFKKAAIAHGIERGNAFPGLLLDVEKTLETVYPPLLLSVVANYGLQGALTKDGVIEPKLLAKDGFSQHHLELFQALAAKLPRERWGHDPFSTPSVEPAVKALSAAADAFAMQRLAHLATADTKEKRLLLQLQEKLRLHTQVVRNWGNFEQVVAHTTTLFAALDHQIHAELGVTASQLIQLFRGLVRRVENKSTARLKMLAQIIRRGASQSEMVAKYYELNSHLVGTAEEFMQALPGPVTRDQMVGFILSHSDLLLEDFYKLDDEVIAEITSATPAAFEKALTLLTLDSKQLADVPVGHIFLDNPVWTRPLLRSATGGYFTAVPQCFFSHAYRIFAHLCDECGLKKELEKRRAEYLEEETSRQVAAAFPHGRVLSNLKWQQGAEEFETDTVAIVDKTMLIFEAKSGAISDPALRGAPDRAKRHVRDLIVEPSTQSERFQRLVIQAIQGEQSAQAILHGLQLWPLDVSRFARVTITLEDFSVVASSEGDLKELGWVDKDASLAPSMTLADFEVVREILDEEPTLIHYLCERLRLQKRFDVVADELDWLGFYLKTSFAFAATEKSDLDGIMLTGLSKPIDDFTNARDQGLSLPKPSPLRTELWRGIIAEIGERRFPGWIEAAIAVIRSSSPDQQRRMESEFKRIVRRIPADWRKAGLKNGIMIFPIYDDPVPVTIFGYPSLSVEQQRAEAAIFAQQCFTQSSGKTCLTIGFNADFPDKPFEYLAFSRRGD